MASQIPQPVPSGEYVPEADQRIVLTEVPWSHYEVQLALRGERRRPRISYLQGALELLTPSEHHERFSSYIGHIVAAHCLDEGIDFSSLRSWTIKRAPDEAGAEPDDCFVFGAEHKDRPDLAIEIVWTSGGIDKLEIYRRLGVPEVWYYANGKIDVHVLGVAGYQRADRSAVLPALDLEAVCSVLDRPTTGQAIRAFRDAVAARR